MNVHASTADTPHHVNAALADMDHADMRRALAASLLSLKPIEERIVRLRFGIGVEERLMTDIAHELDIGVSTVETRLKLAMRKLKHPARSRRYRGCIMGGVEVASTHHDEMLRWASAELTHPSGEND